MLFNSLSYAIFLPVVFLIYWKCKEEYRWIILLISSYYFYMSWNPKYVILILGTTLVSYFAGIGIERADTRNKKRGILIVSVVSCILVLFIFKYINFFSESICILLGVFSIHIHPITLGLLLPVGISFYTFQTLSYVIDVYRGDIIAERHFGHYATFVSFFPQLVAGPIERSSNLLPQIKEKKVFDYGKCVYGLRIMLIGFLKKIVIADSLAVYVDNVYKEINHYDGFSLVLISVFFSIQIYCDFSGYSDIAIGSARLMGIDLMTNFKSPYLSQNVKEFWRRWHISLSTWLRDYVYIPIGGNRVSSVRKKMNLLITFLISGLWHGANWTYVLWGLLHGVAQIIEDAIENIINKKYNIPSVVKIIITFSFCNLLWILFRAESIQDAIYIYMNMFNGVTKGFWHYLIRGIQQIDIKKIELIKIAFALGIVTVVDYLLLKGDIYETIDRFPRYIRLSIYWALTLIIIFFMPVVKETQFIYFQF